MAVVRGQVFHLEEGEKKTESTAPQLSWPRPVTGVDTGLSGAICPQAGVHELKL